MKREQELYFSHPLIYRDLEADFRRKGEALPEGLWQLVQWACYPQNLADSPPLLEAVKKCSKENPATLRTVQEYVWHWLDEAKRKRQKGEALARAKWFLLHYSKVVQRPGPKFSAIFCNEDFDTKEPWKLRKGVKLVSVSLLQDKDIAILAGSSAEGVRKARAELEKAHRKI